MTAYDGAPARVVHEFLHGLRPAERVTVAPSGGRGGSRIVATGDVERVDCHEMSRCRSRVCARDVVTSSHLVCAGAAAGYVLRTFPVVSVKNQ